MFLQKNTPHFMKLSIKCGVVKPLYFLYRSFFLCYSFLVFLENDRLDLITSGRIDRMCDIPIFSIGCFAAWHCDEKTFLSSITLMSCTTNSSSMVMETTAFIFPSFATFLTRTSVMFIFAAPFLLTAFCA